MYYLALMKTIDQFGKENLEVRILDQNPDPIINGLCAKKSKRKPTKYDGLVSFVQLKNEFTLKMMIDSFNQAKSKRNFNLHNYWYELIHEHINYIRMP